MRSYNVAMNNSFEDAYPGFKDEESLDTGLTSLDYWRLCDELNVQADKSIGSVSIENQNQKANPSRIPQSGIAQCIPPNVSASTK